MKRPHLFLFVLFFISAPCFSGQMKRYDVLAADLSRSIATFSEFSKPGNSREIQISRDPMQPLADSRGNILRSASAQTSSSDFVVRGIVGAGTSRTALINDKFYSQGDKLGNDQIVEIRPDGVVVQNEKGSVIIPLYPDAPAE